MPINFTCPNCGATTEVADQYAGQSGPCAHCGKTVTVPLPGGTCSTAPGAGSRSRAIRTLLSGWSWGTQRSSPIHRCTPVQSGLLSVSRS